MNFNIEYGLLIRCLERFLILPDLTSKRCLLFNTARRLSARDKKKHFILQINHLSTNLWANYFLRTRFQLWICSTNRKFSCLLSSSLRASSPIWASEASLARTRERGSRSLARSRETCFTRPNRRACSQANCHQNLKLVIRSLYVIVSTWNNTSVPTIVTCTLITTESKKVKSTQKCHW